VPQPTTLPRATGIGVCMIKYKDKWGSLLRNKDTEVEINLDVY
jgi:hypothetical protein